MLFRIILHLCLIPQQAFIECLLCAKSHTESAQDAKQGKVPLIIRKEKKHGSSQNRLDEMSVAS